MSSSIISPEDLCNQALDRISWPDAIGDLMEGSKAARIGLRIYGQTRDELLSETDWQFARREVSLTLLKTAPVGGYNFATPWTPNYPLLPWVYEYAYPDQCIQVRSLRRGTIMPNWDPTPNIFTVANDPALGSAGLLNNGGFLALAGLQPGWPTTDAGLPPGSFFSNGLFVNVTPGGVASGSPLTFPGITAAQLLLIGAGPLINSPRGPGQLFINGTSVGIAPGGATVVGTGPAKVVLTNISAAVASFTAQVVDPQQWLDSQFVEAMVDRLALRFQEALRPDPNSVKIRAAEDQRSEAMAQDNRG